jgi:hypothetical protein
MLVWAFIVYSPIGRCIDMFQRILNSNLGSFLAILVAAVGGIFIGLAMASVLVWGINPCGPVFWGH